MELLRNRGFLSSATILILIAAIGLESISYGESDLDKIEIKSVKQINLDKELWLPKWSPDLRYCSFRKGSQTLVCYSAKDFKRLFEIPYHQNDIGDENYSRNQWSPNGKHIYGIETNKDEEMALIIYNASGDKVLQTPYIQSIETSSIKWSPNSRRVVFNENRQLFHELDIWAVDIPTKETKSLTPDDVDKKYDFFIDGVESCDFSPEWSPNGEELIYVSGKNGIIMLNLKDNNKKLLLSVEDSRRRMLINKIRWSPNGTYIAYNDLINSKICIISTKGDCLKEYRYSKKFTKGPSDIMWLEESEFIFGDFDLFKSSSPYGTSKMFVLFEPKTGHVTSWEGTADAGISHNRKYLSYVQKDDEEICNLYIMDVKTQKTKKLAQGKAGHGESIGENKLSFTIRSKVFWTSKLDTLLIHSGFYWYQVKLKGIVE